MNFEQFDEAYLARLCQRDPEVEEHFTAYFSRLILIKLRQRLRSRHAIEDVRQETFLRVFRIIRSGSGLRHPERLGALVNAVCKNVMLETYRSRRYEELPEELGPDDSRDVLDGLISEEQRREVQRVLDDLPERDRQLLRAVFLDEANRDAVCAQFEVDRDYLRVLLHRAKESFRARFRQTESSFHPRPPTRPQLRSS
ncbi:MAG TPA: sigma-70 family RNA polymerase sigma factor [Kofleriaceae bacterium]|nr:sigma-70 family RNA polymerase sigma factor [Kofleriaceae bacterium]